MIMRLRQSGISDTNMLRAMETVPRSAFVDVDYIPEVYDEKDLPVVCGQSLPAPFTVAILCQTLEVEKDHKVLQIGTGSGYTASVLGQMCTKVYSIDRYKTLVEQAEKRIMKYASNVVLRHGDGWFGWRGQAPFDRTLLTASVDEVPPSLFKQLTPEGRLVAVVGGRLATFIKTGGKSHKTELIDLSLSPMESGKSRAL